MSSGPLFGAEAVHSLVFVGPVVGFSVLDVARKSAFHLIELSASDEREHFFGELIIP